MASEELESFSSASGAADSSSSAKDGTKLNLLTESPPAPIVLSKGQLKKIRKKEKWEKVKLQKRKAEKDRRKERMKAARERGEELAPSRKQLKHNTMEKSDCKIQVAIDCSFDQYMAEKDIKMLVKQIQFSYSANRRAESPLQLYICSVVGKVRQRMEDLGDYRGWDLYYREQDYQQEFEKSSVVYLSSESPNILQTLEEDKVYVIGGLVDHNHHKGLCHKLAVERGMSHAQLPISNYIDMKTRKVLAVNHVFEILLRYTETRDWQKAFYSVIPQRKGASLKPAPGQETWNQEFDEGDNSPQTLNKVENSAETDTTDMLKGENSAHLTTNTGAEESKHSEAVCETDVNSETCRSVLQDGNHAHSNVAAESSTSTSTSEVTAEASQTINTESTTFVEET